MSQMEAGRELDALIVEKVMGWAWFRHTCIAGGKRYWARSLFIPDHNVEPFDGGYGIENVPAVGDETVAIMNAPNYSTDIAAAWQVVEKMRERGWHFLLMVSHESGMAIASFYLGPHDRSDLSATEEWQNAPRAICRAALKAMEART